MQSEDNTLLDMAWSTSVFFAQDRTLDMISRSARSGFGIPLTGGRVGGIRTGGWGALESGLFPGANGTFAPRANWNKLRSLRKFERAGLTGFRKAEKEVALSFGQKMASNMGTRYLIGRAAGLALTALEVYTWIPLAAVAGSMVYGTYSNKVGQKTYANLGGGYFPDSQGAATSRQRAMQAITASSLQARSAIGNEAQLMHR